MVQGHQRGAAGGFAGVRPSGAVGVAQASLVCPATDCATGSFTEVAEEIAPVRSALTTRAGRWATTAVGRDARAVSDVADELGCDWHTVNKAVLAWGEALLAVDVDRVGSVEALGLDETLFGREGRWRCALILTRMGCD